ncbi:hypothetical protein Clole_2906 [Cellulosilyticum lentocellum DSM 5427]|uniref:Uncharacterized protein n=1 Tax=Cellulosilyticum lentocellum (strain ATCC 49066 / DSM 5427 / NCIMB 11756 / RHM5) TaxID=642492 RepID=F2JLS7_CELLD|nr:hypothetical protein Clole_2906 [Cellulosilyticum lentocellum DSM 5427]
MIDVKIAFDNNHVRQVVAKVSKHETNRNEELK